MSLRNMFDEYLRLPRAVHILCLGTFINRAGTFVVVFLTLYIKEHLHFSTEFATLTMGAFGLGAFGAALVGGQLADAIGRRVVMLFALFGGAAFLVFLPLVTNRWSFLASIIGFAFVADMYRPAASAMIADLVEPARRPHAYGLMYLSINLGFSIAPLVGGWLAVYSYRMLFWADAVTTVCYAAIILFAIAETLPSKQARGEDRDAHEPVTAETLQGNWLTDLGRMAHDRLFVTFAIATLFLALVFMQSFSTFPLYLEKLGFDTETYGRIIAVNGFMIVFFQMLVTSIVTRFHRGGVIVAAALLTGIGFGLKGVVDTALLFAVTVAVWTMGEIMLAPLMPSIVSDLAPVRMRARYMGVLSMCHSGGNTIGAPLGGLILARAGAGWLWGGCLAVGLLAATGYAVIARHLAVKPASESAEPAAAPASSAG